MYLTYVPGHYYDLYITNFVLISELIINFRIYLPAAFPVNLRMADWGKKRGRRKYKNFNILKTKLSSRHLPAQR